MKAYIGAKIILAEEMTETEYLNTYKKGTNEESQGREGYLVQYSDNYKSWSPKETFETAYREVTEEERRLLKQTIKPAEEFPDKIVPDATGKGACTKY